LPLPGGGYGLLEVDAAEPVRQCILGCAVADDEHGTSRMTVGDVSQGFADSSGAVFREVTTWIVTP
jgi:hypothetical protein